MKISLATLLPIIGHISPAIAVKLATHLLDRELKKTEPDPEGNREISVDLTSPASSHNKSPESK